MLIDLASNMASVLSLATSISAAGTATADGAWKDLKSILGVTTVLFSCAAASGTLTTCTVAVQTASDGSGTGATTITDAAIAADLSTAVFMKRFQRSQQFGRIRVTATAGTSTAVIVHGMFVGQKQVMP